MPPAPTERRNVAVLFAGLVDFASWTSHATPEEAGAALDDLLRRFRSTIERFGGAVDKFVGDVVMAVFGAPVAHGDDALRALRCALALRAVASGWNAEHGTALAFRAGINGGEVVWGGVGGDRATATGDVVNVSRRVFENAVSGSIVATGAIERETARYIQFRRLETAVLKNREEPVTLFEVESELGAVTGRRLDGAAPLVGRNSELQELVGAAASGTGSFRVVQGEAGVGKSRLAAEVRRELRRRVPGLWAASGHAPDDVRAPLAAFAEIVAAETGIKVASREDLPRLIEALAGQFGSGTPIERENGAHLIVLSLGHSVPGTRVASIDPARLEAEAHDAWERWLSSRAGGRPIFLGIEDLHAADERTTLLLERLSERWNGQKATILVTSRPGPATPRGFQLFPLLDLAPHDASKIAESVLGALPDAALATFLASNAGGNPYFIEELARFLVENGHASGSPATLTVPAEGLPTGLRSVLVARLDRLPGSTKDTLKTASVAGREFWARILASVAERDVLPEVADACRRDLLAAEPASLLPGESQYAFRHALLRDAAYSLLTRRERTRLHECFAQELEARIPAAGRLASALAADQRASAGQPDAAVRLWLDAAEEALACGASREALSWTRSARNAKDSARGAVLEARAYRRIGQIGEAVKAATRATELAGSLGEPSFEAWNELSAHFWVAGPVSRALEASQRAGELATTPEEKVRALCNRIPILSQSGQREEGSEAARRIALAAEAPGVAPMIRAKAREAIAFWSYAQGDLPAAEDAWRIALSIHREAGDRYATANAMNNLGIACNSQEKPAAALRLHEEALAIRREIGDRLGIAISLSNIANVLFKEGRFEEGLVMVRESYQLRKDVGDLSGAGLTLGNVAFFLQRLGRLEEAYSTAKEALAIRRDSQDQNTICETLMALVSICIDSGNAVEAGACAVESIEIADRTGNRELQDRTRAHAADLALRLDDAERAIALCRGAIEARAGLPESNRLAFLFRLLSLSWARLHKFPEAERALAHSAEIAHAFGDHVEIWLTASVRASLLDEQGRSDDAKRAYLALDAGPIPRSLRFGRILTALDLARITSRSGAPGEARAHLDRGISLMAAQPIRTSHGVQDLEMTTVLVLAYEGRLAEAREILRRCLADLESGRVPWRPKACREIAAELGGM